MPSTIVIFADALIALACLALPAALALHVRGRPSLLPAGMAVVLLAAFLALLGLVHLLAVAAVWLPVPPSLIALGKSVAAAAALVAAVAAIVHLPALLALRTPAELAEERQRLREEVTARELAEDEARQAQQRMDRAVRELEQFAYITSHDLQTPLRTIAGFSQLLSRRHRDKLDGDALEFLDYIDRGTQQMTRQIQDLLALSRVGRVGASPIERKPLADAVARAIRTMQGPIDASGAEIACATLPEVEASHALLAQLLAQLIDNAIKFQHPGERPKIRIDIARDGDFWDLIVADNGIGIPSEHLEAVFQIFRKLHAPEVYPGTGIGLAIGRKIAEFHGGTIHAASDGSGTRIHLRLPVAVPKPRAGGTTAELRGG